MAKISFHFGNFALRFSKSEFDFFINCLRNDNLDSAIQGDTILKFALFHRLNDGTVIMGNSDSGKGFFVSLQLGEIENLLAVEKIFSFLLEHQKDSDESLKRVFFGTYIETIYADVMARIWKQCKGCQDQTEIDYTHFCQNLCAKKGEIGVFVDEESVKQKNTINFEKKFAFLCD